MISYTLPWSKYIWLWYFQFTILDWQKYNLIIQTILLDPTPLANRVVSPSFKKKTCSYYISYAILNSISHLSPLWPPTRKWPSKPTSIKSSGTNQWVCPTYTLNSIQFNAFNQNNIFSPTLSIYCCIIWFYYFPPCEHKPIEPITMLGLLSPVI